MRDLVLTAVVLGLLPFCIKRPYIGLLVYVWISFMNPHRLTYGFAFSLPFAQIVAIVTLLGVVFNSTRERRVSLFLEREAILLLLLWCMFTITTIFAMVPDSAWPEWQQTSKIFLMTFLAILLIDDRRKLRYLCLVIAFSFGFYGLKGGIFLILRGGTQMVWGPEGTFFSGNNGLGLVLNMTIPFLFYLSITEQNRRLKILLWTISFFTLIAIIGTYSRGAFLGLVAVFIMFFLKLKFAKKALIIVFLTLFITTVIALLPAKWIDRMGTIQNYEEDDSAMSRIEAWKASWRLAVDHPIVGGGFEVQDMNIFTIYNPEGLEKGLHADVHSVYFEVLSEHGFITFAIFIILILSSLFSLRKIRQDFKNVPSMQWICNYSHMIEISLIAYMVGGIFLELSTFDFLYMNIAIVIILQAISRKELKALYQ